MRISRIGKESIYIVIEIINRRIEWIKENEPHATDEIDEYEKALGLLVSLIDLEISK